MKFIAITGMHRSGTSMTSRVLQFSGLNFGENLLPPSKSNIYGYFENNSIVNFNREVFKKNKVEDYQLSPINISFNSFKIEHLENILNTEINNRSQLAFKDPRISVLLPYYKSCNCSFIFVFRKPIDVIVSMLMKKIYTNREKMLTGDSFLEEINKDIDKYTLRAEQGANTWFSYNLTIKQFLLSNPQYPLYSTEDISIYPENFVNDISIFVQKDLSNTHSRKAINTNIFSNSYPPEVYTFCEKFLTSEINLLYSFLSNLKKNIRE